MTPIRVDRCNGCGANRGGVIDLTAEKPSFQCFQCYNSPQPVVQLGVAETPQQNAPLTGISIGAHSVAAQQDFNRGLRLPPMESFPPRRNSTRHPSIKKLFRRDQ